MNLLNGKKKNITRRSIHFQEFRRSRRVNGPLPERRTRLSLFRESDCTTGGLAKAHGDRIFRVIFYGANGRPPHARSADPTARPANGLLFCITPTCTVRGRVSACRGAVAEIE